MASGQMSELTLFESIYGCFAWVVCEMSLYQKIYAF